MDRIFVAVATLLAALGLATAFVHASDDPMPGKPVGPAFGNVVFAGKPAPVSKDAVDWAVLTGYEYEPGLASLPARQGARGHGSCSRSCCRRSPPSRTTGGLLRAPAGINGVRRRRPADAADARPARAAAPLDLPSRRRAEVVSRAARQRTCSSTSDAVELGGAERLRRRSMSSARRRARRGADVLRVRPGERFARSRARRS